MCAKGRKLSSLIRISLALTVSAAEVAFAAAVSVQSSVLKIDPRSGSQAATVTLVNTSAKPIKAYSLKFSETASDGSVQTGGRDEDYVLDASKAWNPGERYIIQVGLSAKADALVVTPTAVVFSDDSVEGQPDAIRAVFDRRRAWVATLEGVIATLQAALNTGANTFSREALVKSIEAAKPTITAKVAAEYSFHVDDGARAAEDNLRQYGESVTYDQLNGLVASRHEMLTLLGPHLTPVAGK